MADLTDKQRDMLEKRSMKIFDSREPGNIRMRLHEIGWQQQQLYTGDYWFFTHDFKKVCIERKAVNDFMQSIGDRLSRQLENMLDHYDKSILLLEGSWQKVSAANNIVTTRGLQWQSWTMVWNYIRRWQDKGVTLELTINEGHTVSRLNELYALYQKPYSMSSNTGDITDDRILAFPSGCRGKTALDCLEMFGSLSAVASVFPNDLMTVEKVGWKKAISIYDHFHKGEESIEEALGIISKAQPQAKSLNELEIEQGKMSL